MQAVGATDGDGGGAGGPAASQGPLSARERARLDVLGPLVAKGRVKAGSPEAAEYEALKAREAEELAAAGEVVIPVAGLSTKREQSDFYGVSERTIGYWREKGAPLQRPRDMLGWWAKTYPGKPVNQGILACLGKVPTIAAAAPRSAEVARPAEPARVDTESWYRSAAAKEPAPVEASVEVGFDATHSRMLAEEARLYGRIQNIESKSREARQMGNVELAESLQVEADGLRPQWVRLSESLGAADTRQIRNALQRGDLVHRQKVELEYAKLIRVHPEVLRFEMKAVREQLDPVPPAAVWDARVDKIVDELFRQLPDKLLGAA